MNYCKLALVGIFLGCCFNVPCCSLGQDPIPNPLISHEIKMDVDSGLIYHKGDLHELVWSQDINVPDAVWLRFKFSHLVLAGSPLGGESSILRITSLTDGAVQTLNAVTAQEWRNTTAYFNGNSVRLELFALPNGRLNLVRLETATVGDEDDSAFTDSICDGVDDRILSDDVRIGRTAPGGCTAWLFNNQRSCLLTAGHCRSSIEVVLFNVPLSNSNGTPQFPGPEDQYSIDQASVQFVNGGVGNDWCYFGCFDNADTGLSPFEAQGDSLQLADPAPVQPGDMIRITGFGTTSSPVNPMWNQAQKTHVGNYQFFSSSSLAYRTDTTGGNSGSPIIFEATGRAIGIHTHGGCTNGGGMNQGTGLLVAGLVNALNNPLGICQSSIGFLFPDGLPTLIDPAGGTELRVQIDDPDMTSMPGTATLHVDTGGGFQPFPMQSLGGDLFSAQFPMAECGDVVNFYVSVQDSMGGLFTSPLGAPAQSYNAVAAVGEQANFEDNFQTDMGWQVSGNADTGMWQRGIPAGGGDRGDPPTDADGSGACYVTGIADGDNDVDGGSTTLTSPTMDGTTSSGEPAVLSYYRWFSNQAEDDSLVIEISNNNGVTWQNLETVGPSGSGTSGGWILRMFVIQDVIAPTNQMKVRITASDIGDPSIVEAGIDGVAIEYFECALDILLGDVNRDGVVNLLDVQPFVVLLSQGGYQAEADINGDGVVNLKDVQPFVALLGGG